MNRNDLTLLVSPGRRLCRHAAACILACLSLCASVAVAAGDPPADETLPAARSWTIDDATVAGHYVGLIGDVVQLRLTTGVAQYPLEKFAPLDQRAIIALEDTPLPLKAPDWMNGYALRYQVRLMDDPLQQAHRQTVMVSLPTGGWLQPDASDLRVVTASGKVLPAAVLSHDPQGNTLLHFTRHGMDRWYWVYARNPDAPPQVDDRQRRRIEQTRNAAREASLKVMELRRASAEAAGELRDIRLRLQREEATLERVGKELENLAGLIPERQTAVREAETAIPPLETTVTRAEAALATAERQAETMLEQVRQAERRAAEAETQAAAAAVAHGEAVRRGATVFDEMQRVRMVNEAQAVMLATRQVAATRKQQITEAEEAAVPSRMAAAGARTALDAARKAHSDSQNQLERLRLALEQVLEQRTAAQTLKAATEANLTDLRPRVAPLETAAEQASAQAAETAARAEKMEADFHAMSLATDPRTHREGLSLEIRDWGGDQLDELSSWSVVVNGLMKSDNVLGNSIVTDVLQKMNPFRLGDTLNFAASYRGYLNIEKGGLYRLLLNSDDAAFLFLNDYLVYSRVGSNRPIQGRMNVFAVGEDIELSEGVYRIEIHQVTGNTPGAEGRCAFYWILPEADAWSRVPPDAFVSALPAAVIDVEAADGRPVAIPRAGVANTLVSGGFTLHLARFEARGLQTSPALLWDFGDGLQSTEAAVEHVYFNHGDYDIALRSHSDLPPFRKRLHVWNAPVPASPLAAADAIRVMESYDLERLDAARLNAAFAFLSISGQPTRWPLLEAVSRKLLAEPAVDLQYRVRLYTTLMEALAQQGRTAEAVEVSDEALAAAAPLRSLTIDVQLQLADIYRRHLRDFDEAGRYYALIVEQNRRLALDSVRRAAIGWGDMFVDMGDTGRAAEIYRLAGGLGQTGGALGSATDAATRGALLRVAEQQLRDGNIRHTRQLLERIEQAYPDQKVEGLYRFLRAETDRHAGRYLEAIRNYEVLMRLQQWAGYRASAMFGLADCHYRLEDYETALRWIVSLRDTLPAFYQQRELAPYHEVIAARLDAQAQDEIQPRFAGVEVRFDHGEPVPERMRYRFMPLPGMSDGDVLALSQPTDRASQYYDIPLRDVVSEGAYWVEFWYRNEFVHSHAQVNPRIDIEFRGEGRTRGSSEAVPVIRSFGQWFMGAALLRAPVTQHGSLRLSFNSFQGLQWIDGIRVRPVSALQEEALLNLLEGVDTP